METCKVLMFINVHSFFFCLFSTLSTQGTLTITPNHSLQGNQTLVSAGGTFEAGLFNIGNSQSQYFGIWYKSISPRTIVWVANRDVPVQSSEAIVTLTDQGNLVIVDGSKGAVWTSNISRIAEKPNRRGTKRSFDKQKLVGALAGVAIFIILLGLATFTYMKRKKLAKRGVLKIFHWKYKREKEDVELSTIFVFSTISSATNHFSDINKLGEGGFGPVYKAWRLWIEERPLELIDELLDDGSTTPPEILRCINVELLCVQQIPENRPNMSSVVLMLNGEKLLPEPSQPGFYTGIEQYPTQVESSSRSCGACSQNEASVSLLEAR
ncbi:hypothetical protein RJT34_27366 [Clitoria ternatea]|uniref:Bulb-type lectin domain-containing protein n=1 Tax=Clitoria ternatea TaxID=43366 RepID=A0AAN9F9V8_CLITE